MKRLDRLTRWSPKPPQDHIPSLPDARAPVPSGPDCGRFQESATLAQRRPATEPEVFKVWLRISARVTALTLDQRIGAVEFYRAFRTRAGEAMQSVDILRNDHEEFARSLQTNDGMMNRIRLSVAKSFSSFELVIPMLDSRCFRGQAARPIWP